MESRVAVTYQIDEPELAAEELCRVTGGNWLKRNSVGILFCYADTELRELVSLLKQRLPFQVVGCTTIAGMDQKDGFHALAATLTVLTADDCAFSVGLSDEINPGNVKEQIGLACRRATGGLNTVPGMVFALPPYQLEIMLDEYTMAFNELMPGVPVVGGLPSYNADGDENLTIGGGGVHPDRLVVLAVGGNIRPVFSVQTITSTPIKRKRKVTSSKGNVIYRVGDQTFTEYLTELGLPVEKLGGGNSTVTFVANPLLVEQSRGDGDSFAFLRTLHEIDLEQGSGTAIGRIPENATVSICPMDREEIVRAAREGMEGLKEKMKAAGADGYRFSTVLAISCIGRHLLMSPNNSVEVDQLLSVFPGEMTLSGFYSYGEIGPLPDRDAGSVNFAHNESMVLCAF